MKNFILNSSVSSTTCTQYSFSLKIETAGTYTFQIQTYLSGQEFVLSVVDIYVATRPAPDVSSNNFIRSMGHNLIY